MSSTSRLKDIKWVGLSIAFLVVLAMAALLIPASTRKPAHLPETATEIGSVAELRYPYVVPDHVGARIMVALDAETGPGILLFDIASGARKWLYEENQNGYVWAHYKILGWASDDSLLAYGHQSVPRTKPGERIPGDLFIADGRTGETVARIQVAGDQTNTLSQFAWLSPHSFAFLNAKQDLFVYEQKPEGWVQTQCFTNASGGNLHEAQALTAMSTHAVTWKMREAVWTFDFAEGKAVRAWGTIRDSSTTNIFQDAFFSPETGKFLLTCRNGTNRLMHTFDPAAKSLTEFARVPPRVPFSAASWINQGKGYAYTSPEWGILSLSIKSNLDAPPVRLLKRGEVRSYTVVGDRLYICGTLTNEPPGIWEYNVSSGSLRCLLSSATLPLQYTKCVPFEFRMVTNSAGTRFAAHYWTPDPVVPGRKYPLIIGNTPYSWTPFPMASANAGYFFMTADRSGWNTESLKDWKEVVMGIYDLMAKNPNIDTNQVYLYARSIETGPMSELLSQKPQLWKGAIMFDPGDVLPDLSKAQAFKIFIAAGQKESPAVLNQLTNYQQKASAARVPVRLVLLEDAPHISYGVAVQRQRVQELVKFLSNL